MSSNRNSNGDELRRKIETFTADATSKGASNDDRRRLRLIENIIDTCLSMADNGITVADLKLVDAALGEMHRAFRCFEPFQHARKVTTFGSARTLEDTEAYRAAREFARAIAEAGFMVITGAGPGIMQACQEGAGRERSFGVNIRLPFENQANPFIRDDPKLVDFKYFFTRKLFFLKESSAVVMFPGGFGTHDECFETLTLVQTGKSQLVPIVFIDVPGGVYWKEWDEYVKDHLRDTGLISPDDLNLYKITHDIDEAVREIADFYRVYHSSRVLRDTLIVRIEREVSDDYLRRLSDDFSDILGNQPITVREPYDEERDEPEIFHLPRLAVPFDMRSYGRLRCLINRLNEAPVVVPAASVPKIP